MTTTRTPEPYYVGDLITAADSEWHINAVKAVIQLIGRGVDFTQEDVAALGTGDPSNGNHWGALFQTLARRGLIVASGYRRSTKKSRKGGLITIWFPTRDAYYAAKAGELTIPVGPHDAEPAVLAPARTALIRPNGKGGNYMPGI